MNLRQARARLRWGLILSALFISLPSLCLEAKAFRGGFSGGSFHGGGWAEGPRDRMYGETARGGEAYRGRYGGEAARGPYGGAAARGPEGGTAHREGAYYGGYHAHYYGGAAHESAYYGNAYHGAYYGKSVAYVGTANVNR